MTLGANWIIGHDIIFDRENNLLGIAEANCYQNKNINTLTGLELDIENNIKAKNINIIEIKKIISIGIIIFATFLIILMIFIIFRIIFRKLNQMDVIREMKLKIKDYNTEHNIDEINKKNNDSSYIEVFNDNSKVN